MKFLVIVLVCFGLTAKADDSCKPNCDVTKDQRECVVKEDCTPKIRKLNAEIAKLKAQNAALVQQNNALQNREQVKEVDSSKNSVSLVGALSATKLKTERSANSVKASTGYEPDLGLMYQRDFNSIRASIAATLNGTGLLGVGYNF